MAAFCSKALHQEWRLSAGLCGHPSTGGCEVPSTPRFFTLSAFRSTLLHGSCSLSTGRAHGGKIAEKMRQREQVHVKPANRGRATQGEVSGVSASASGRGEGMGRNATRDVASLVADKDAQEGAGRKHGYASRRVDYKDDRGVHSSGHSSPGSGGGWAERKSRKGKAFATADAGLGGKIKGKGDILVGEKKEHSSKKIKVNSAEVGLRIGLDMCSKRGDVMGAISLYDSAVREGVKLGQYHYNVLLYLCASAAGGVIYPAKSGSSSHSSSGAGLNDANLRGDFSDVLDIVELNGVKTSLEASNGSLSGSVRQAVDDVSSAPRGSSSDRRKADLEGDLFDGPDGSCKIKTTFEPQRGIVAEKETENGKVSLAGYGNINECGIQVNEDTRKYALTRGFEIYKKMCLEEIPLSEAALTSVGRMAMSMGDGDMAFEIVKKIKDMGLTLRLRSYGPALFAYCNSHNIDKAFEVERDMTQSSVHPEEPELQALLRVSMEAGRGEKVYYILQKLRTSVRQVSPATAELIEAWFKSSSASRVGKRKWDQKLIEEAFDNGGGGWHGLGWLGKGKWTIVHAQVDADGTCESCGERLVTIDLDPIETESFAKSVATIAGKRERSSNFQKFQKWLDYYGPFEAVIDAANVGLFSQKRFSITKVNSVVNGIRQKLPSKKWPLVIVHNKRIYGGKMNDPTNVKLVERWKNADAIYTTPTGSNDDWYWLYAAIKCKSLIVTNDEMRDHTFQLLGNDFFPKWKERHQVHFSFRDGSPEFLMPPPCSIVIQESKKGHWHIPIAVEHDSGEGRIWLCVMRADNLKETNPEVKSKNTCTGSPGSSQIRPLASSFGNGRNINGQGRIQKILRSFQKGLPADGLEDRTIVFDLERAEELCGCVIDFQI